MKLFTMIVTDVPKVCRKETECDDEGSVFSATHSTPSFCKFGSFSQSDASS
jgi:hypothetical protein